MQLVAYGAQDIYLTGNPQITFFKVVYRRHTNFSMEAIEQTWNGTLGSASRQTCTVSRNGDLVHRMYLEVTTPSLQTDGTDDNYGHGIIDNVELEIGGQKIDKHTGAWMETWSELTEPNPTGAKTVSGATDGTRFQRMALGGGADIGGGGGQLIWVPLQFWFCRNPGLALPLIALQYHEVKVILTYNTFSASTHTAPTKVDLFCDYIYLDTDERRRFAQVSHEYLIEQVQEESKASGGNMDINFNHPVKELIWTGTPVVATGASTPVAIGTNDFYLKLNGHDRFAKRDYRYFTRTQIWQHHTGYGGTTVSDSIGVYSFALKPEEHQPSGTCNFSRIDNAQLIEDGGSTSLVVYAVNYNVLRIMSGMGGLAYSN